MPLPLPAEKLISSLTIEEWARHRLLGFAYSRGYPAALESRRARDQYLLNLKREAYLQGLLREIGDHPLAAGLSIGLLKGPALWGDLYRPGERESADLDLYIEPIQLPALLLVLYSIGFDQVIPQGVKTLCLNPQSNDVSIEIHTQLWRHEPADFRWRWQAARQSPFRRLAPEDQLIHLCGHLIAQHTLISLHWLIDIILFIKQSETPWDFPEIRSRAVKLRLARSWQLASQLTDAFCSIRGRDGIAFGLVNFRFLIDPRRENMRYFLIKHLVQDRVLDALAYDLKWFACKISSRIPRVFPKRVKSEIGIRHTFKTTSTRGQRPRGSV